MLKPLNPLNYDARCSRWRLPGKPRGSHQVRGWFEHNMVSLASTCTALWRGQALRLDNGTDPHALKGKLDVLRQECINGLTQKLGCEDLRSLLRSSPDLRGFAVDASDARMIASLYLHDLSGAANGKAIRCKRCFSQLIHVRSPPVLALFQHALLECAYLHLQQGDMQDCSSCPGRRVDGGPLPIDEIMGVKAVDSINLSRRRLGTKSTIIICACVAGNRHLRELNLSANELSQEGATALAPAVRNRASLTSINLGSISGVTGLVLKALHVKRLHPRSVTAPPWETLTQVLAFRCSLLGARLSSS